MSIEISKSTLYKRITNSTENIINFIRVAPQWHIPGIIIGANGALAAHQATENLLNGKFLESIPPAGASLLGLFLALICEAMAYIYLKDYKQMKGMLFAHGWDERVVSLKTDYYCGRRSKNCSS